MLRPLLSFAASAAVFLPAQDAPAAPAPKLPAANSAEARALVDQALEKMQAYGRGTFATTEGHDNAMLRQAGIPIGNQETELSGGWHRELVWGDLDGRQFVSGNGRMLAKVDGAWRLRRDKLAGGMPLKFALDPNYLFTVLQHLPQGARNVAHVEAGRLKDKDVVILSLQIEGDDALELSDSGALPDVAGGMGGGIMMFGGLGGMAEPPRPDVTTFLALFVDPASGDLLRLAAKVYEKSEMMGNIQIAVQGGGAAAGEEEEEKEEAGDAKGETTWKRGFPKKKPAKDESVLNYRIDFDKLGLAEAPALDDRAKALLHAH